MSEQRDLDAVEDARRQTGRSRGISRAADRPTWKPAEPVLAEQDAINANARCAGSTNDWSAPRYQTEARHMRTTCMACPVRQACLDNGRRLWGWGMWGGVVLVNGYVGAEAPVGSSVAVWSVHHSEHPPAGSVTNQVC